MSRDREDKGQGEEAFASRWSRLKRQRRVPPAEAPGPADAEADAPPDERSDEEVLEELGLPDPDTLKAGDDFKAFMASAVPARIRNRALRKLWTSNPVLANLDRLVDYDDDFTDAAMVPEILRTGYQVGRGWIEDTEEERDRDTAPATAEAEAESEGEESAEAEAVRDEPPEPSAQKRTPEDQPSAAVSGAESRDESRPAAEPAEAVARADTTKGGPSRARRMRFRFAEK